MTRMPALEGNMDLINAEQNTSAVAMGEAQRVWALSGTKAAMHTKAPVEIQRRRITAFMLYDAKRTCLKHVAAIFFPVPFQAVYPNRGH